MSSINPLTLSRIVRLVQSFFSAFELPKLAGVCATWCGGSVDVWPATIQKTLDLSPRGFPHIQRAKTQGFHELSSRTIVTAMAAAGRCKISDGMGFAWNDPHERCVKLSSAASLSSFVKWCNRCGFDAVLDRPLPMIFVSVLFLDGWKSPDFITEKMDTESWTGTMEVALESKIRSALRTVGARNAVIDGVAMRKFRAAIERVAEAEMKETFEGPPQIPTFWDTLDDFFETTPECTQLRGLGFKFEPTTRINTKHLRKKERKAMDRANKRK